MVAVPDAFVRSAVFLSVEESLPSGDSARIPSATAFLVSVPLEGTDTGHVGYFVTARHCLYEARAAGHDVVYLRLNRRDAPGFMEVPTKLDDWFLSDVTDVAAILFVPAHLPGKMDFRQFDVMGFQMAYFVGPAPDYAFTGNVRDLGEVRAQPVVGTEIAFIGLFTQHYGSTRNLPVARFGHISRMPSELEFTNSDGTVFEAKAYLAECQSWGGHSGSPAYFMSQNTMVNVEVDEDGNETGRVTTEPSWISGFLGMISGHYDIDTAATVTGEVGTVTMSLNSGIAIVVPADDIRQLITRDDLLAQRKAIVLEMAANNIPFQ